MAFPDTPFPEAHFCTSESKGSDQKTNNRPVSGARCPRWATVGSVVSHPDGPRSPGDRRGPCRRAGWPYHGRASDDGTRKGYKPDIFPSTVRPQQHHCFSTTKSLFYPIYHREPAPDMWAWAAPLLCFPPPTNPMQRRPQRWNLTGAPRHRGATVKTHHAKKQ